ncbi:MAG: hypothetical protein IJ738_05875 [Alphaproteobacteria bacterium]|nr:hypothetical protein [Alphaproteobacteria bacterium]
MIDLYSILHRELNNIYKNGGAIWIKNNNWIYSEWDIKQKKFEENKTVAIIKQINLLNEFCRENNIRMYMLIVPSKESIYARFLPMEYQKIIKHNQFNQYINSLISSLDVPTVFPYDELHQASYKDFVFFKQSHHWTDWGAYTGYLALMEVIKKDYPNIHISTLDEYNISTSKLLREDWGREYGIGQTTRLLYINQKYAHKNLLKDNYTYYDHKNEIKPIVTEADFYKTKYFKNPQQAKAPRVLLTGTSMNEDFLQFLPYSFSEIKYYRLNNVLKVQGSETFKLLKRYKKDILDYNPNILILCVTSGNVLRLDELTKE